MFERARRTWRIFRAYRAYRKAGETSDVAIDRAINEAYGLVPVPHSAGLVGTPSEVVDYWADAEQIYRDEHADEPYAFLGNGKFEVTAAHLALVRDMRFAWDGVERGAPMLDPERPYGRHDLFVQLRETFPRDETMALARQHTGMLSVLMRVLRYGRVAPGRYRCRNITPEDIRYGMQGYCDDRGDAVGDEDIGLEDDGSFMLTDEHIKLLRELTVRWPPKFECDDRVSVFHFPAATGDGKRPYGDYTFIEVDMARILDFLPPAPEDGIFRPTPELARRLQRLHWQMLPAIQVFVENADLEPGTYEA